MEANNYICYVIQCISCESAVSLQNLDRHPLAAHIWRCWDVQEH